jgi:hypothetical protein
MLTSYCYLSVNINSLSLLSHYHFTVFVFSILASCRRFKLRRGLRCEVERGSFDRQLRQAGDRQDDGQQHKDVLLGNGQRRRVHVEPDL